MILDTNEAAVLLIIAYAVVMGFAVGQCYLYIKCVVLKRENRIYRRFFEQQYHLESDCMDACCDMIRESVGTTNSEQHGPGRYVRPPCRSQKER